MQRRPVERIVQEKSRSSLLMSGRRRRNLASKLSAQQQEHVLDLEVRGLKLRKMLTFA